MFAWPSGWSLSVMQAPPRGQLFLRERCARVDEVVSHLSFCMVSSALRAYHSTIADCETRATLRLLVGEDSTPLLGEILFLFPPGASITAGGGGRRRPF